MGYPTKVQLISRKKGNQWYVNFPNALAEAMNFVKGETVEWTVVSIKCLQMNRSDRKPRQAGKKTSHRK
jgi:antitoxin component of MazEF toxin-antitoxin module